MAKIDDNVPKEWIKNLLMNCNKQAGADKNGELWFFSTPFKSWKKARLAVKKRSYFSE